METLYDFRQNETRNDNKNLVITKIILLQTIVLPYTKRKLRKKPIIES